MIDGLKPYSQYEDSRLPWLGKIPSHWEVRRNGRLFVQRNETGFPDLPILEVSLKTGVRVRDMENLARKQVMSDKEKYKRAKQGDIAYNMMRMWQGAVGVAPVDGLISPAYVVARPLPDTESRYYQYVFRTGAYMNEVNKFLRGIVADRNRLYWEDFKQMPSPCLPPEEQTAIVQFLDYIDRRVRRYIRAKLRLIEVLHEQKQAIIHNAVTRGLDPNVPTKPSGVEWLGDVPKHWQVLAFSRCAVERADYRGATPTKTETGVFLVTAKNIRKGWIDYDASREYVAEDEYEKTMRRGLPQIDDFLLTTEAPLGHAALVDRTNIALAQRVIRFRLDHDTLVPQFALHSVLTPYFQNQLLCRGTGSTALGIKASKLPQLRIVTPPIREQEAILKRIDLDVKPLDGLIRSWKKEIDVIREYRTRIILEVVTGALDIRGVTGRLPDEGIKDDRLVDDLLEDEELISDAELDCEPAEAEA